MSRFIKKIISTILICVVFCCMVINFAGCGNRYQILETEHYIYQLDHKSDNIAIIGLTDKGKEQEYLVIPETIDGKKVISINNAQFDVGRVREQYGDPINVNYRSEKLKKVFFVSSEIEIVTGWLNGAIFNRSENPSFEAWFCISNENKDIDHGFYRTSFLSSKKTANVSYYYNCENAPNDGYYWIDNYGYSKQIEYIPESPVRQGYTFGGWYKESECFNVWDFETDTLPEVQYDERGKEVYQETKLYAKWIKNS